MNEFPWLPWLQSFAQWIPEQLLLGVGLLALADPPSIARKTILGGSSAFHDAFLIAPGLHKQSDVTSLSKGEYPACAAMTTGYVFRVENEAMVYYMQQVGRPGELTTLYVTGATEGKKLAKTADWLCTLMISVTSLIMGLVASTGDFIALASIWCLLLVTTANTALLQQRTKLGWKGQKEPGVKSDLLVLLSQDRWVRIQGMTDDVKVVTSGQWQRSPTAVEDMIYTLISFAVHLAAGFMFAASHEGRLLFFILMISNSVLLKVGTALTDRLVLYDRDIQIKGARKSYGRRLDMAEELIKETGRDDWCEKMGIVLTKNSKDTQDHKTGAAHM